MHRIAATVLIAVLALGGATQDAAVVEPPKTYDIESPGRDVRDVIHSLFTDAHISYILDPTIRHQLYLSVYDVDFDTAFRLLREQANLQYEVREGIYYIGPAPVVVAPNGRSGSDFDWEAIFRREVTIKKEKAPIRTAFAEVGKAGRIQVQVDPKVPDYLVNVSFNKVTVRYALDNLTKAAGLEYEAGLDGAIRVRSAGTKPSGDSASIAESANTKSVTPTTDLKCPNCSGAISVGWKYCPVCGFWVKPITTKP